MEPEETKTKRKFPLRLMGIALSLIVILGILGFFFGIYPVMKLKTDAIKLNEEIKGVTVGLQSQNLPQTIEKLTSSKNNLQQLQKDYRRLSWLKIIPYFNRFYKDGQRLINAGNYLLEAGDVTVEGLKPYADLIGIQKQEEDKQPAAMTTEQRLMIALDTFDKIQPSLDKISEKLVLAQKEIDQIDPQRYPEKVMGKNVRAKVILLVNGIDSTTQLITEVKPLFGYLKPLLGIPEEKKYLLLFQNDAELRPTGGFLTAYAILSVKNGNFKPLGSFDIYTLDSKFGNRLPAPQPIKDYHKNVFNWHLRDMNLSPDFKVSMETFLENYGKVASKSEIAGVIAVDTKVLVDLLKVLGPVGVADWGNFSANNDKRCDCPQVVYELERLADQPLGMVNQGRKAMLGPLMHSILLNIMQSPRKTWPEYFNLAFKEIQEKHMLFYFFDENIQKAMEAVNASGRIKEADGDYFHLNDCNFAGAKSNLFIQQSVNQEYQVNQGEITKTVTIDYKNPFPASNCNLEAGELCLNGLYRDWVRLYVPKGSQLIESSGSEIGVRTYDDLGKTVFEAFYGDKSPLRPQGKAQLVFKYKLPFKTDDNKNSLLIQKQPGTDDDEYIITINGKSQNFILNTDKEIPLSF